MAPAEARAASRRTVELRLAPLFDALAREVGIHRIGPDERLRAARLLRAMFATRDRLPAAEVRGALAALLANNDKEWRTIARLFEQLVGGEDVDVTVAARRISAWRVAVLCVAGIVISLGATFLSQRYFAVRDTSKKPAVAETPKGGEKTFTCKQDPIASTFEREAIPPRSVETTHRVPAPPDRGDYLVFALTAILAAFGVRCLGIMRPSRRAFERRLVDAERRRAEAEDRREAEHARLHAEANRKGVPARLEYHVDKHAAISQPSIEMAAAILGRVPSQLESGVLDVRRTIGSTIAAGGRGVAVFRPSVAPRPIVVLVDRGAGDHPWLGGFEQLLERLSRQGVRLLRYDLSEDFKNLHPNPPGAGSLDFAALARRHAGLPLVLFSPSPKVAQLAGRPWLAMMDPFPLRIWINPDPRPDRERDPASRAVIAKLAARGFARFDLDDKHVEALARYVAAGGAGARVPERRRLPDILDPRVQEALRRWATICALVPDARWDQVESVRREFAEINHALRERRDVSLLIDWVNRQEPHRSRGTDRAHHTDHLDIPPDMVEWLVAEARGDEDRQLVRRGHLLILKQLSDARPGEALHRAAWEMKRATHRLFLENDEDVRRLLSELRDSTEIDELRRVLRIARQVGTISGKEWEPETARLFDEILRDEPEAPEVEAPSWRGPAVRELLVGHGGLWGVAGGSGLLIAAFVVFGLALGWRRAPLGDVFVAEVKGIAPSRPEERELYRLVARGKESAEPKKEPATQLRPAMVEIPGGEYPMGSPETESGRDDDEKRHMVKVSRFLLGETEVTRGQYRKVMKADPSTLKGADTCPVESVSWKEAAEYCNRLSQANKIPSSDWCYEIRDGKAEFRDKCKGYRLPTEIEWEWAARGGCAGMNWRYVGTAIEGDVCEHDNVADQRAKKDRSFLTTFDCDDGYAELSPVAKFQKNGFHLHDMGGNVWEWTNDFYKKDYENPPKDNAPVTSVTGQVRVIRGGSWYSAPRLPRVAYRDRWSPSDRAGDLGFRVARSLP